MTNNGDQGADKWLDRLDPARAAGFLLRPGVRWLLAWAVTLAAGGIAIRHAWRVCDDPRRRDGNWGHATNIDFVGQWLLGRMIVEGRGQRLYNPHDHRAVLERALPRGDQKPAQEQSDVEEVLGYMIALDDGDLGGPLYPPVHAVLYAPLGLLPPRAAYRLLQIVNLLIPFAVGGLLHRLSAGRLWWPVATLLVLLFPGYAGSINLGQNATLSLGLLVTGWWLLGRGRPAAAGVVWGFLAFKPVWAAAFFLVPLLTQRWRFAAAMLLTGVALALLTLPLVGWHGWLDWLEIGRAASAGYDHHKNWILLSRDLQNVPRRWLVTFDARDQVVFPYGERLPKVLGLSLWLAVTGATVGVTLARRGRAGLEGPAAAFVLLGAWLSCYHFMFYDVLLAALPVCLLFTEPRRYLELAFVRPPKLPLSPELMAYYRPNWPPVTPAVPLLPGGRGRWVWNPLPPLLLVLLIGLPHLAYQLTRDMIFPPWDTYCLLALWLWSGWAWLRGPAAGSAAA
jgi:hypothetical protein